MIIKNATQGDLNLALHKVNEVFDDNVQFKEVEQLNRAGTRWRLTLRVVSSKGRGARRGQQGGRRMVAACFHVHGVFFDNLPAQAVIHAGGQVIHPSDGWVDKNIGSVVKQVWYSDACDCRDDDELVERIREAVNVDIA